MSRSASLCIPILMVEPPTPFPPLTPRHGELFGSSLPIPFLDSLDFLNPFEEEKIDYNLLSAPGPPRRRRRSLSPKPRSAKPVSFVGISLLGIAAIILLTSIASLTFPLQSRSNHSADGLMGRFRGKMHVALALEVQGGAMLRDMTFGELWTQVTHRDRTSDELASEEAVIHESGQVRAMSNDAWEEYTEKRSKVAPAAGLDFWDFH